jgi:hypothetical protein
MGREGGRVGERGKEDGGGEERGRGGRVGEREEGRVEHTSLVLSN